MAEVKIISSIDTYFNIAVFHLVFQLLVARERFHIILCLRIFLFLLSFRGEVKIKPASQGITARDSEPPGKMFHLTPK